MQSNWLLTGCRRERRLLGRLPRRLPDLRLRARGAPVARQGGEVIADISARVFPPNLVLLLDKSESMDRPEDPTVPACTVDAERVCASNPLCNDTLHVPTRLSRAREALSPVPAPERRHLPLPDRLLAVPPGLGRGRGPLQAAVPVVEPDADRPSERRRSRPTWPPSPTEVRYLHQRDCSDRGTPNNMQDDETAGGTPTAASLRFIRENVPALKDTSGGRSNFVLLLTDGLPNCNEQHPPYTSEGDPANPCRCALATPRSCEGNPTGLPGR